MSDRPSPSDSKSDDVSLVEKPPTSIGGILMRLGPGLIVAGSIVGSGELIATTATGAQAGFWLLWLILIGCVIKVFVQVELGRYTLVDGKTTMEGLAEVPGPRIPGRGNWLVWYWFAMFLASTAQLGGIVGGVGQALSISAPLTENGGKYNDYVEAETQLIVHRAELNLNETRLADEKQPESKRESATQRIPELHLDIFNRELQSSEFLLVLKRAEKEPPQDEIANIEAFHNKLESLQDKTESTATLLAKASPLVEQVIANEADIKGIEKKLKELPRKGSLQNAKKASFLKNDADQLKEENDTLLASIGALDAEHDTDNLATLYLEAKRSKRPNNPVDDKIWATIITIMTAAVLYFGRYGLIQSFSTTLVALFTMITIVNLCMLQGSDDWGVSLLDIIHGMSFKLHDPAITAKTGALGTALATFGIIGVGASELVTYPYWCLEKGYARFTGPKNDSSEWAERARGWMRVMRWDAWCSMGVYTFATIAFYLLGAAILGRTGLDPKGTEMIRYLSVMYQPVFGQVAQILFLFGAFAVLYSTFFVANASLARVFGDALSVLNFAAKGEEAYRNRVRILSALLPFLCLSFYVSGLEPVALVLFSGMMQAIMLPMLAGAALFFRYYRGDRRISPGKAWDVFLWVSALGMLVAGAWAAWSKISSLF